MSTLTESKGQKPQLKAWFARQCPMVHRVQVLWSSPGLALDSPKLNTHCMLVCDVRRCDSEIGVVPFNLLFWYNQIILPSYTNADKHPSSFWSHSNKPCCVSIDPDHRCKACRLHHIFSSPFFVLSSYWLFSKGILHCHPSWWYKETGLKLAPLQKFATKCHSPYSRRNHKNSVHELHNCYYKQGQFLIPFLQATFLVYPFHLSWLSMLCHLEHYQHSFGIPGLELVWYWWPNVPNHCSPFLS